jgi:hypothetical protein
MTKKQLTESVQQLIKLNKEDLRIIGMMTKSQMKVYLTNLQRQSV